MDRAIIHLNVADFAVAVERVVDPRLRGRAVIVAPPGAVRAAVYDMSDEAFRAGVRKGMPLRRAVRLARGAAVLPPHADRYERAMRDLLARALPYSPLVEQAEGLGHLFLDTAGTRRLFGPPADVAWRIRRAVRAELGLDPIWSVAPSKLVAKVASRLVKPQGEYIVEAGEEEEFLRPLPLHLLPGVGREVLSLLRELNLSRVGEVAALGPERLEAVLGCGGWRLHQATRGVDPSPVLPAGRFRPVLVMDHEFGDDTNEPAAVEGALYRLVERLGRELRERRLAACRLGLVLDYSDGVRLARLARAARPTASDRELFDLARLVLARAWVRRVRLRHLRLRGEGLVAPPAQLELFAAERDGDRRVVGLERSLDGIRARFGLGAIHLGRALGGPAPAAAS